jgi:hypothetical protein
VDSEFRRAYYGVKAVMKSIHDRLPLVLDAPTLEEWMNPNPLFRNLLRALLKPAPDDRLVVGKVSRLVNAIKNDGTELLRDSHMGRRVSWRCFGSGLARGWVSFSQFPRRSHLLELEQLLFLHNGPR